MQPPDAGANQTSVPDLAANFRQTEPAWRSWISLGLLIAVGAVVRFAFLAKKPFWFDEGFSAVVARLSWTNFVHLMWWREANMSLYYLVLRGWIQFGGSEFFIRSLSVLISVATLPAIYWLARLLYDRRIALIATALLAFHAFAVRYAQEARSYALLLLLATLSSGLLVAYLREPRQRTLTAYRVVSILAVYAHFYALLLIGAQWLAMLWVGDDASPTSGSTLSWSMRVSQMKRSWKIIGVGVLPLLIFVGKTGAGPIKWISRPGIRDLLAFSAHLAGDGWPLLVISVFCCLAAVLPFVKRLWSAGQSWETWRCQFLLTWLLFPIVLTVLLSFARPVFLDRYMIFCLPALVILMAAGLSRLRPAWLLGAALAGILLLSWQGVRFVYSHDFDAERDASGEATNFILDHAQPGDGIIFHIAATRVPYEFFRTRRENKESGAARGPEILFPNHGANLSYRDFTGKPTEEFVRATAASHPRIWLMLMNNGPAGNPDPTTLMLGKVLQDNHFNMQHWQFAKVEVRLYSR